MMWDARLHAVTYGLLWVFTETSGALHTGWYVLAIEKLCMLILSCQEGEW